MFGSYPYPRNFYAQNTTKFITVYVKDGRPKKLLMGKSLLTNLMPFHKKIIFIL